MPFQLLIGNESAKVFLLGAAKEMQVLLFSGSEGVGKRSFAQAFLQERWGEVHAGKIEKNLHPDVHWVQPEGKTHLHSVASLKEMMQEVELLPFEAPEKVFLIEEADRMLPPSSNLLLKTLEEPPAHVLFILLTSREEEILPTLLSRMVKVSFFPIEESLLLEALTKKNVSLEKAKEIVSCAQGSFSKALALLEGQTNPMQELFKEILQNFFLQKISFGCVESLDKLGKLIEKQEEEVAAQIMDRLLEDFLFHLRDLHYQKVLNLYSVTIPSLEAGMTLVNTARLSTQRHTKPRVVLEQLFQKIEQVPRI